MLQEDCHTSALREVGLGSGEAAGIASENDDCGPVSGPHVLNHVVLARKRGEFQTTIEAVALLFTIIFQFLAPKSPKYAAGLTALVGYDVTTLIRRFLFDQKYPNSEIPGSDINLNLLPRFSGRVSVYHSAVATYYAPSDASGVGGMYRERIRVTPAWNRGESSVARHDCILVQVGPEDDGFRSMQAARVRLFFSIIHDNLTIPCALVEWFETVGNNPHGDVGMWVVKPDYTGNRQRRVAAVIHLDSVVRGVHLIPVYKKQQISRKHTYSMTLNTFRRFYVNKYIDYHAFETIY